MKHLNIFMINKDKRMSLIMEVLNNIKTIKMNALESLFYSKINTKHEKELKYLKLLCNNLIGITFLFLVSPSLIFISILGL